MSFLSPIIADSGAENDPLPVSKVGRSLKFNQPDSVWLERVFGAATDQKKGTISLWLKRGAIGGAQVTYGGALFGNNDGGLSFLAIGNAGGNADGLFASVYNTAFVKGPVGQCQDPTAWMHLVFAFDTTQATVANRLRVYVNGVEFTAWATDQRANITLNSVIRLFETGSKYIGRYHPSYGYLDALMAEFRYIDGQQLLPTDFGAIDPTTGQWSPIAYAGTYGAQGCYLDFSDNTGVTSATIGKDRSGNNNDWTPNGFSIAAGPGNDSSFDSPADYDDGQVHGNFPVLMRGGTDYPMTITGDPTLREGRTSYTGTSSNQQGISSLTMRTGKWYWEVLIGANPYVGIVREDHALGTNAPFTDPAYMLYAGDGTKYLNGVGWTAYGSAITAGMICSVAFDADTGKIWWAKNGVWFIAGDPASGANPGGAGLSTVLGHRFMAAHNPNMSQDVNFGQRPFTYAPPAGFKALCALNQAAAPQAAGSFKGNALANGPMVDLGGPPSSMTINGNAVIFGTHARKLATGVKIITTLAGYNAANNTFTAVVPVATKNVRAQLT